jgi:hypothetical protein
MADPVKEILRHLFQEIVKDKDNCKLQFELLKEYREKQEGSKEEWANKLKTRFPQYFGINQDDVKGGELPVKRRTTMADGNCFFSGIFRAAVEQGIIRNIIEALELKTETEKKPPTTEEEFIRAFRYMLSKRIKADKLPKTGDVDAYDYLYNTKKESNETYQTILTSYPVWFQTEFNNILPERKKFLKIFAEGVNTYKNWVGEIEVQMTKYILDNNKVFKVILQHYNSPITTALPVNADGKPILHLVNNAEIHWEYFSFQVKGGITFPSNGAYKIPTEGGRRTTPRVHKKHNATRKKKWVSLG